MFSRSEVQPSRARLIVECKEAPDSTADLRDPGCRAAVLRHLEHEFGIETIVLSHYVEKQYGARAMDILRRILAIVGLLDRLGSRAPTPKFPGLTRKQVAAKCSACPFNPKTLFGSLRGRFVEDFAKFHAAFSRTTTGLARYREPGCRDCTAATANDLIYLFHRVAAFGASSVKASLPEEGPM